MKDLIHFLSKHKPPQKIEVFSRHCVFSKISQHKERLPTFSHAKCFQNWLITLDETKANITYFLDVANGNRLDHYLEGKEVIELQEGTESGSFLSILNHVQKLKLHPDTILYFVEDDYLHLPGWIDILKEGFQVKAVDYVTLYDHRDKYKDPMYENLEAKLYFTQSCHWRETPSTTQTFACRFKTLLEDMVFHKQFSENVKISQDHLKFLALKEKGRKLISSIPGYATHVDGENLSPCRDWKNILQNIKEGAPQ